MQIDDGYGWGVYNRGMKVTPLQSPIVHAHDDLYALLKQVLPPLSEKTVVVVTSKVVALSEGAVVSKAEGTKEEKHALVRREADYYLEPTASKYQMMLTIKHSLLAVNAGLDESNADSQYVLLPEDPYRSAAEIWKFLRHQYGLKEVGVLITDSKTFPLKWGTMGTALAYCGFAPLNNFIGKPDLFGKLMNVTQVNVAEGLAAAAVVEMGEADEAQPFCLIEAAGAVRFTQQPPSPTELKELQIAIEDDVYGPLLTAVDWQQNQ